MLEVYKPSVEGHKVCRKAGDERPFTSQTFTVLGGIWQVQKVVNVSAAIGPCHYLLEHHIGYHRKVIGRKVSFPVVGQRALAQHLDIVPGKDIIDAANISI